MPEDKRDPGRLPAGWLRRELDAAAAEAAGWPEAKREQTPAAQTKRGKTP
jgi:hypothetical protein